MTESSSSQRDAQVRRSPKLLPIVVVFAVLGVIATAIVTSLYPADPSVGFLALFGYFALYGVSASMTLGVVVWLVLDARSRKRATIVRIEREET
jgi:hypothetical protein